MKLLSSRQNPIVRTFRALADDPDPTGERVLLVELKTVDRPSPLYGGMRLDPRSALPDVLAKRRGKYGA